MPVTHITLTRIIFTILVKPFAEYKGKTVILSILSSVGKLWENDQRIWAPTPFINIPVSFTAHDTYTSFEIDLEDEELRKAMLAMDKNYYKQYYRRNYSNSSWRAYCGLKEKPKNAQLAFPERYFRLIIQSDFENKC